MIWNDYMFANPFALLALSLLALPILIHMLVRLKGRRVLFPTVKYLRATESHLLRPAKIERWPLLVVRLLACGLLIFAISDPALVGEGRGRRAVLLLIDSSLSMNTAAAKEQARSRARELIALLGADDVAAVAQFDSSVNLLCDFTSDRDLLEKSIARYSPNYGMTDFSRALTWAGDKLSRQPYLRELALVSDLQAANVFSSERVRLSGVDLKIVRVEGGHRINARPGSTTLKSAGDNLEVETAASLGEGDRTTITTASFKLMRRDKEMSAAAHDSNATLSARLVEGDLVVGAVTANKSDQFDADDSRFFVARLPMEKKILLVESRRAAPDQAAFMEKAIQASSQSKVEIRQAEISGSIAESADALARYGVVIAPVDALAGGSIAEAREYVRRGGSLIVTVGVEADIRSAAEKFDELRTAPSQTSFNKFAETESVGLMPPVMPADNSDDAQAIASSRFLAACSIQASEGEALLRYSNDQPAAVRVREGAGRIVILGFGLTGKDSSLCLSPVFPVFIEWLISSASTNDAVRQFTIGQAPTTGLLRGLTRLTKIYTASGPVQEEVVAAESGLVQPGVYEAEYQSERFIFALNSPAAESMLDQTTDSELLKRIEIDGASGDAVRVEKRIALWRALAICALVMSLLELGFTRVASGK